MLAVIAWATIEWPNVQGWAYHAQCENLYRHDPMAEQDQGKCRAEMALHLRLRRHIKTRCFAPGKRLPLHR